MKNYSKMLKLKSRFIYALIIFIINQTSGQVPSQWIARGMGGGGAVYSPSISPHNKDEVYLGCDMSVMSHSMDFGNSWQTISFDTLLGHRHSKVNFTNHPDTMYVELLDQYTSKTYPAITKDHGLSWTVIPNKAYWGTFGSFRLFANAGNSRQVIASNLNAIFFSNNWGSSFTQIHAASIQGSTQLHLAGVLYTNDTIFVSTDKGLLISPNNGNSWNSFVNYNTMNIVTGAGNEAVVSFSGAQTGAVIRLICTTISANNLTVKTEPRDIQYFQKIYRLDFNSQTGWNDITPNLKNADNLLNAYNYAYQIAMNSGCTDTFYLTGQTRSPATTTGSKFGTVYKSTDGGNSFTNQFLKNNNSSNANISTGWMGSATTTQWTQTWQNINTTEGLCIDPNNISRIMRSDFSMVCVSEDGGATWDQRYVFATEHPPLTLINPNDLYETSGLQTTVSHWLHWMSPSRVLACYSDLMLHESNDSGRTWGMLFDSIWSQKVNDIAMLCVSPSGRLYAPEGETLGNNGDWSDYRLSITHAGKIMYSDDAKHWHLLKNFAAPVSWAVFDALDTTVMYVTVLSEMADTVGGIWKCSGLPNSPVWTKLNHPPRTERRPTQILSLNNGDLIVVYGGRDSSTTQPISYSYMASAGVFLSSDHGNTWSDLCAGYPAMQKDVRFLTIDPNDALQSTWLLGIGSSGLGSVPGLYRTTNRGSSWNNVWNGKTVLSVTFNPAATNEMYICTMNDGLYYATAASTSSPSPLKISSYPFRAPERVFFNPYNVYEVWVSSWGNGLRFGRVIPTGIYLPVELLSFSGYREKNDNFLNWSTASESFNESFEIERSSDAITFIKVGRVDGNMNSNEKKDYFYIDKNVSPGINYYRLKQIDQNGEVYYSRTIAITYISPESNFTAWPVPFHNELNIDFFSSKTSASGLKIKNASGQVYWNTSIMKSTVIFTTSWPAGLYFILCGESTLKVIKQ